MTQDNNSDEIDRRMGVFIEHLNDQFERVLEAVDSKTAPLANIEKKLEKLDKLSDNMELLKADAKMQYLTVQAIKHDSKMLRLRVDQILESQVTSSNDFNALQTRVANLETA